MALKKIDHLVFVLASYIRDEDVVSTGVASLVPLLAILLARRTHAPESRYINCIGALDPSYLSLPCTSEHPIALADKKAFIPLIDLFDLGARGGIDSMFFSAAQIDQKADSNLTCIGDYVRPKVKLAGPAGSSIMMKMVKRPVLYTFKHSRRVFVQACDFASSAALRSHESIDIVSDLGVIELGRKGAWLRSVHPWSSAAEIREATGFELEEDLRPAPACDSRAEQVLNEIDPEGKRNQILSE